jgi:hypothetical protein
MMQALTKNWVVRYRQLWVSDETKSLKVSKIWVKRWAVLGQAA